MFLRFFYEFLDRARHPIASGFVSAGRGVHCAAYCRFVKLQIGLLKGLFLAGKSL